MFQCSVPNFCASSFVWSTNHLWNSGCCCWAAWSSARVNIELLLALFEQTKINLWPGLCHKSSLVYLGKDIYGKIEAMGEMRPGAFDGQQWNLRWLNLRLVGGGLRPHFPLFELTSRWTVIRSLKDTKKGFTVLWWVCFALWAHLSLQCQINKASSATICKYWRALKSLVLKGFVSSPLLSWWSILSLQGKSGTSIW